MGQGTRKFGWGDLESRGFCRKGVWGWEVEGAIVTVEIPSRSPAKDLLYAKLPRMQC